MPSAADGLLPLLARSRRGATPWAALALVASGLAAAPRDAAAAPPDGTHESLHVLELASPRMLRPQARALTEALRARVLASREYALGNTDYSLEVLAAPCFAGLYVRPGGAPAEPPPACLERVSTSLRDPLRKRRPPFLWGVIAGDATRGERLTLRLHLWREDRSDALAEHDVTSALASAEGPALEDTTDYLWRKLLGETVGRVRVRAPVGQGGVVYVDGEARGELGPGGERELVTGPGRRRVELRRADRAVARGEATVGFDEVSPLALAAVPADAAPAPPAPPIVPGPHRDWRPTAGWVGLGLGAAALGMSLVSSLRVRSIDDKFDSDPALRAYRQTPGEGGGDACDGADRGVSSSAPGAASAARVRTLCSGLSTFTTLQYVGYGGAAVFAGLGTYFLLTARRADPTVGKARAAGVQWLPWGRADVGGHGPRGSILSGVRVSRSAARGRAAMRSRTVFTLGVLALGGLGAAGGCTAQNLGWLPPDGAGASGASGQGGTAGQPVMGAGGAGTSGGNGSGGSGGDAACVGDAACTEAGSLCVGKACTEPTTSCAKATLVVVPDPAFAGELAAELEGACFYRALGPALAAAAVNGDATTRVVAYASAVEGPAAVPAGVRLEGRPTAPATLVTLAGGGASGAGGGAGAAGAGGAGVAPALVTLGDKAALAGFALDAEGAVGVRVATGKAALEGPLELRGGKPALSVEGTATATVTGKADATVLFTANARGVRVGPTAGLTMTGDTSETGLAFIGTNGGAAVLVEAGGTAAEVALTGVQFRSNTGGDVLGGEGAVEVRSGRKVTSASNVFENNSRGLTLNGGGVSGPNDFVNVSLAGNRFVVGASAGVAICGADFLAATTLLRLGTGNELPSGTVDTQAECAALSQQDGCNGGASPAQRDLGVLDIAKPFVVQCPSLPPRLAGGALP